MFSLSDLGRGGRGHGVSGAGRGGGDAHERLAQRAQAAARQHGGRGRHQRAADQRAAALL